jgi:hypothetical protein
MENVEFAQEIENLKNIIESGQQEELDQLKGENVRLKGLIARKDKQLEPLKPIIELFKQVDGWKEKELTVAIRSKEVTKNILAFAHQRGWNPEFLVRIVLEGLFRTDTGRSTLGMIIAKTVEAVEENGD